jgi:ribosomal-protein-alanine N-acetyltransferase
MPVILETPRLVLRTWTLDDAEAAFAVYSDPEVMRFLSGPPARDVEETRARLAARPIAQQERYGFCLWAVVEKATGTVIGSCGLKHLDDGPDVEVGYHLARSAWGKGYATEAAAACLRYGFERLGLRRILAVVNPANGASRRVLEKIGMRFEGMGRYYNQELRVYAADRPAGPPAG